MRDGDEALGSVVGPDSLGLADAVSTAAHPFETAEGQRYRDPQVAAHGGMGRVSQVVDARLGRAVALKEILPGEPRAVALERRLTQEAFITARLEHPGIVPVYDAGKGHDGRPFFTMRFIRGRSLAAALHDGDLPQATLLRHFLAVCQAMAYAHALGVVHRDLKPSNVMLGEFGETQIVDWGLARELAQVDSDVGLPGLELVPEGHAARTSFGERVGTPGYMSPEQARGLPLSCATDVWSLGAMLFEIVAGRSLHAGLELAALYARLERGPIPRLAEVTGASPELAAIADRALQRDPAARYRDASGLATDVAAFLDGRRVAAYDYSAWDVTRRFARTFRTPLVIAALALVSIAVVVALSYAATLDERDRAEVARAEADRSFATLLVQSAREASRSGATAEAELLAAHALVRAPTVELAAEVRGVLARHGGAARVEHVRTAALPPCRRKFLGPGARVFLCVEGGHAALWRIDAVPRLAWRLERGVDDAAFISDTQVVVSGPGSGLGVVLDVATGAIVGDVPGHLAIERLVGSGGVALGDDGERMQRWDARGLLDLGEVLRPPYAVARDGRLALAYENAAERPKLYDLVGNTQRWLRTLPFARAGAMSAAFDVTGARAAFGGIKGELLVLALANEAVTSWRITDRALVDVAWGPDDGWIAVRDERGWVTLVDTRSEAVVALPHVKADAHAWRAGPESGPELELVVLGAELRAYRVPSRARPTRFRATGGVSALALDGAGARLALPDGNGAVRVFDLDSGALVGELSGRDKVVAKSAAFLHGSKDLVVSWPSRYEVGVWTPGPATAVRPTTSTLNQRRVVALADGGFFAASYGSYVERFGPQGQRTKYALVDGGISVDAQASADGRVVAWVSSRGAVERLMLGEQAPRGVMQLPGASRVALDGAGDLLAVAGGSEVHIKDVRVDTERVVRLPGARIVELALARDGGFLAAGTVDGGVWVWDARGALRLSGAGHLERVSGLAFGPTGDWLVSAGWDGVALRWDLSLLDADPAALAARLERAWGVGLEHAIDADLR